MLECVKREGVPAAARGRRTRYQAAGSPGIDILVVSGTEASGHCGKVSMLFRPVVIQATAHYGEIPILAAGTDRRPTGGDLPPPGGDLPPPGGEDREALRGRVTSARDSGI